MTKVERLTGEEMLKRDFLRAMADHADEEIIEAVGDSPIEKLFAAALRLRVGYDHGESQYAFIQKGVHAKLKHFEVLPNSYERALLVEPQAEMLWGRVDFLVAYYGAKDGLGDPSWHYLVVECDGHEWHDRTKEQASKDRERDREAQLAGCTVFRFTGRDLWRDAWGCAGKVLDWTAQFT